MVPHGPHSQFQLELQRMQNWSLPKHLLGPPSHPLQHWHRGQAACLGLSRLSCKPLLLTLQQSTEDRRFCSCSCLAGHVCLFVDLFWSLQYMEAARVSWEAAGILCHASTKSSQHWSIASYGVCWMCGYCCAL